MRNKRIFVGVVALAAASLALAGCAGDGGGSPTATNAGSVKIMVFGSFTQPPFPLMQIKTAAEAAVASLNASGGINGAQIDLISCDDQGNPNGASACGQQAVDENVAAVVGAFTLFGDAIVPTLEDANIPYINDMAISPLESSSKVSFPVATAGSPNFAALVYLKSKGCTGVAMAAPESDASQSAFDNFGTPSAKAAGIPLTAVLYPSTTTDYASVAARIADVGDCVIYGGGPQDSAAIITALNQTGKKFINVGLSTIAFPESSLPQLGDAANGLIVLSPLQFPSTGGKAITDAVAAIKKIDANASIDETAINSYAGVLTFAQAAAKVDGPITADAVLNVLSTPGTTIDTGLYAPVDFAKDAGFFPPIPRAVGSTYYVYEAKNNVWSATGDSIDLAGKF